MTVAVEEAPAFGALKAVSFSFAFEIAAQPDPDSADMFAAGGDRRAFRLRDIESHLCDHDPQSYAGLIKPVRSFLDDVTTGPPGTNGRPLIFAASPAPADDPGRAVDLVREARWTYDYEGALTELAVPEGCRRHALSLRDSFSVFESGRIFYVLTLTHAGDGPTTLDEYAVIQMQQLVVEADRRADDAGYLGFVWPPGGAQVKSLIGLANARLAALSAQPETAGAAANGVGGLLRRYRLMAGGVHPGVGTAALLRLCVAIEDDVVLATAEQAYRVYLDREADSGAFATAVTTTAGEDWTARYGPGDGEGPPRHRGKDEAIDRALLAFAGIAQGVPDFPNQDHSEVDDSTRPTTRSIESSLYSHPKFTLEVARNWRSYKRGRPSLGTCPYLLLMFLVTTHDELIVADIELRLEQMLFGIERLKRQGDGSVAGARSSPLADVRRVLAHARLGVGGSTAILHANLNHRFELFRWGSIHRSGNIFRYPKEKDALEKIHEAMATSRRFDDAHALADRMESLVEDVSNLKGIYAQTRTNFLLFMLALLGIIGATSDLRGMLPPAWGMGALQVAGIIAAGIFGAVLLRLAFSAISRRLK